MTGNAMLSRLRIVTQEEDEVRRQRVFGELIPSGTRVVSGSPGIWRTLVSYQLLFKFQEAGVIDCHVVREGKSCPGK